MIFILEQQNLTYVDYDFELIEWQTLENTIHWHYLRRIQTQNVTKSDFDSIFGIHFPIPQAKFIRFYRFALLTTVLIWTVIVEKEMNNNIHVIGEE